MGLHKDCSIGCDSLKALYKALVAGRTRESYAPLNNNLPESHQSERFLHDVLESNLHNARQYKREERNFIDYATASCSGGAVFLTEEGQLGLAPSSACKNDILVVLLGCSTPMILRPTGQNQFLVVGQAYCHGYMAGEAFLGPLPHPFEYVNNQNGEYYNGYINSETGACQAEDPRLNELELPVGLRRMSWRDEHFQTWFVNDELGKEMVSPQDPRISLELFRERGVEIREFELV